MRAGLAEELHAVDAVEAVPQPSEQRTAAVVQRLERGAEPLAPRRIAFAGVVVGQ